MTPNDSYFLCWMTTRGLDFVVYCEHQSWIMPTWISPLNLGLLFQKNGSEIWGQA